MTLQPGTFFAGYRIIGLLGDDDLGDVFEARHPRLPRSDALKVLSAETSAAPGYRERFEREGARAAGLTHPAIVTAYDLGIEDDRLWQAAELVDAVDGATAVAKRHLGLPRDDVAAAISSVAAGLDHAHGEGVVHGSVSPGHLLLRSRRADGPRALLSGFGFPPHPGRGHSAAFAAPDTDPGPAADQYSLALTAFTLLTGETPGAQRGTIGELRPDLAGDVDAVLDRALSTAPGDRFDDCGSFAAALSEALLAGGAARPTPPPRPASTPEPPREHTEAPRVTRTPTPPWRTAAPLAAPLPAPRPLDATPEPAPAAPADGETEPAGPRPPAPADSDAATDLLPVTPAAAPDAPGDDAPLDDAARARRLSRLHWLLPLSVAAVVAVLAGGAVAIGSLNENAAPQPATGPTSVMPSTTATASNPMQLVGGRGYIEPCRLTSTDLSAATLGALVQETEFTYRDDVAASCGSTTSDGTAVYLVTYAAPGISRPAWTSDVDDYGHCRRMYRPKLPKAQAFAVLADDGTPACGRLTEIADKLVPLLPPS